MILKTFKFKINKIYRKSEMIVKYYLNLICVNINKNKLKIILNKQKTIYPANYIFHNEKLFNYHHYD